jgi:hypothetical protein
MNYIVKLSDCRSEDRNVSGEYDGGQTPSSARRAADFFVRNTSGGRITIQTVDRSGGARSLRYNSRVKRRVD